MLVVISNINFVFGKLKNKQKLWGELFYLCFSFFHYEKQQVNETKRIFRSSLFGVNNNEREMVWLIENLL